MKSEAIIKERGVFDVQMKQMSSLAEASVLCVSHTNRM